MKNAVENTSNAHGLRRWLVALLTFTAVWLLLTEAEPASWVLGIFAVPTAAYISILLRSKAAPVAGQVDSGFNPLGIVQFVPYFLIKSIHGGWDVASRVLRPKLAIGPGFIKYTTTLPPGIARIFFMNIVSLLPGTVSADIENDSVMVHALDTHSLKIDDLIVCEQRVAAFLGIPHNLKERTSE